MYQNSSVTVRFPRAAQNGIEGRMCPVGRELQPLTPELKHAVHELERAEFQVIPFAELCIEGRLRFSSRESCVLTHFM
jgi:hypothetical protein